MKRRYFGLRGAYLLVLTGTAFVAVWGGIWGRPAEERNERLDGDVDLPSVPRDNEARSMRNPPGPPATNPGSGPSAVLLEEDRSPGHEVCTPACAGEILTAWDLDRAWLHARDVLRPYYGLSREEALSHVEAIVQDFRQPLIVRAMALRMVPDFEEDESRAFRFVMDSMDGCATLDFAAFGVGALFGYTPMPGGGSVWDGSAWEYFPSWNLQPTLDEDDSIGHASLGLWTASNPAAVEEILRRVETMRAEANPGTSKFLHALHRFRHPLVQEHARRWLDRPEWQLPGWRDDAREIAYPE